MLFVLLLLSVARPSIAEQLPGIIAVGIGILSADSNVGVAGNFDAGQRISLIGVGDFSSTEGICALSRLGSSGLLVTGSSKRLTSITVPVSDLYVYLCMKNSGLSGGFSTAILNGFVHPGATESDEEANADLEAILQEAIDRWFGR